MRLSHFHAAEPYDYLVLATGLHPIVPPIDGADKKSAIVFRTIDNCQKIPA